MPSTCLFTVATILIRLVLIVDESFYTPFYRRQIVNNAGLVREATRHIGDIALLCRALTTNSMLTNIEFDWYMRVTLGRIELHSPVRGVWISKSRFKIRPQFLIAARKVRAERCSICKRICDARSITLFNRSYIKV